MALTQRHLLWTALSAVFVSSALCQNDTNAQAGTNGSNGAKANTENRDSLSYVIGRDVGEQLKDMGAELRMEPFMAGLQQALEGEPSVIDSARMDSLRQRFAMRAREELEEKRKAEAEANLETANKFLTQNKKRSGVKTTQSGLQYRILEQGTGASPEPTDSVLVSYKGMFLDSTVFDSTTEEAVPLNLGRTIPGLAEGISMMQVGSRYRFFVPPDLAYGEQGAPPIIPPNAVLIFDIRLAGIIPQPPVSDTAKAASSR